MVIWLIGLSGAGKTTLAKEIVRLVKIEKKEVVLVDGDQIRDLFRNDLGYDLESRRVNAERICKLCQFLDKQNISVVCSILSIFPESRTWCRKNLSKYYEVYIDTPISILKERDSKGLYSKFERGEINQVAGMDLDFPEPNSADLIIKNNKNLDNLLSYATHLSNVVIKN